MKAIVFALALLLVAGGATDAGGDARQTLPAPRSTGPDVIDRVMAVVSGDPITLSDVNAALAFELVTPPAGAPDRIGAALDLLIERTLMLRDVERYQPPEPAPDAIDERLEAIRQRLGAGYGTTLKATGLPEEQLKREIRDGMRIQIYLNQRFSGVDADKRPQLVADWIAGLRRRADVVVLYLPR